MIRRFRGGALKRLYERGETGRVRPDHVAKLRDILVRLDASAVPEDMDLPGFRLHRLTGNYRGFWAVVVSANWRVIFRFDADGAVDVDYLDYH
jgi:proteic killer suppression protein